MIFDKVKNLINVELSEKTKKSKEKKYVFSEAALTGPEGASAGALAPGKSFVFSRAALTGPKGASAGAPAPGKTVENL